MVSNKEISEMLAAKREGKQHKPENIKENPVNVKKCPDCGTLNKENAKFCVGCGKSFEEKEVEIKPEDIKEKETKICPSCKSEIPKDAKFCVVCGETQPSLEEDKKIEEPVENEILEEPAQEINEKDTIEDDTFSLVIMELVLDEDRLKISKNADIEGFDGSLNLNYADIENIEFNEESEIKIDALNKSIIIKNLDVSSANKFTSLAKEKIDSAKPDPESIDKINKAKELLDIGAIDEEEYEKIKNKILKK